MDRMLEVVERYRISQDERAGPEYLDRWKYWTVSGGRRRGKRHDSIEAVTVAKMH